MVKIKKIDGIDEKDIIIDDKYKGIDLENDKPFSSNKISKILEEIVLDVLSRKRETDEDLPKLTITEIKDRCFIDLLIAVDSLKEQGLLDEHLIEGTGTKLYPPSFNYTLKAKSTT